MNRIRAAVPIPPGTICVDMRVLFVNDICGIGGVSSQTGALGAKFAERGAEVGFFFYWDSGGRGFFDGAFRVTMNSERSLARVLCEENFDLLIMDISAMRHGAGRAIRLARFDGAVIGVCHGYATVPFARGAGFPVVAVSEYIAGLLKSEAGVDARVIVNGIDASVFSPDGPRKPSDRPVLLWVGRSDDPCKDFVGFACAAGVMAQSGYRIWVVDGAAEPRWNTLGDWLGASTRVLRAESPEKMAEIYRGAAASSGFLLSTSQEEALGLAIAEAMACGCPVAAPNVGGIPEMVQDGITGCLYERESALDAVCNRIADRMADQQFREGVRSGALEFVNDHLSLDVTADEYLSLYQELSVGRSPRRAGAYRLAIGGALSIRNSLKGRRAERSLRG